MVDFGKRLKELRLKEGMTQQQLADKLRITKSVVSYYELQERYPSPEVLTKLALIFHVTTDYLLCKDDRCYIDITGLTEEESAAIRQMVYLLQKSKK